LNRASLDYLGITLEEWQDAGLGQVLHPQDAEIVAKDLPGQLQSGSLRADQYLNSRQEAFQCEAEWRCS